MKYTHLGNCDKLLALGLLLALLSFIANAQQPQANREELPNFHRVSESLYRGGQPKNGGLKKLSEMGVKTVIDLRGESDETRAEAREAKSLGLEFFNLPLSSSGRPDDEQVRRVFVIIEEKRNAPVFVHCRRGSDRTGVIIALYRIKQDGWTAEQAIKEANLYGMGFIQFRKRQYINDYYKSLQTAGID
ncbi:MAG: tyrosine-protein phosphatase, partial [Blastocatellia bacterium]|nr:tyrosine-protein phosphatase [Blastocatellia bacterium]